MIKNANSLKDKARNIAKENNISIQEVLQNYMFERVLERLSKSTYKENFIIKGGLLLSSIMGINLRTTIDIDTNVTGINFEKEEILKIFENILNIDIEDEVTFIISKIEDIKEDNEYNGYRFNILAKYENVKIQFHVDISTGDVITPRAIEYKYKKIFEDSYINIYTYNQETIIAEKFQTIIERKIKNSRMKDYYDIYFFANFKWNEIDKDILREAIIKTFIKRNSIEELKTINETIIALEENPFLNKLWYDYVKNHLYAEKVSYVNTINAIRVIKEELFSNSDLLEKFGVI
jgi:Domain of unknown function (DUF1814).